MTMKEVMCRVSNTGRCARFPTDLLLFNLVLESVIRRWNTDGGTTILSVEGYSLFVIINRW